MRSEYSDVRLQHLFTRPRRITHRELINLIRQLPEGCRLDREMRGESADWTLDTHLLRVIANSLIAANYQRAQKRVPKSAFIDPPTTKGQQRARTKQPPGTAADLDALFGGDQ